jgi:hypothetical protein
MNLEEINDHKMHSIGVAYNDGSLSGMANRAINTPEFCLDNVLDDLDSANAREMSFTTLKILLIPYPILVMRSPTRGTQVIPLFVQGVQYPPAGWTSRLVHVVQSEPQGKCLVIS